MLIRITILSILLLSGCRTIEKTFSSADSKRVSVIDSIGKKSEQNTAKFNREIITEYVVDTLWRTQKVPEVHVVEVPKPYIIKQTIRESGESAQNKTEDVDKSKTETVETSQVEKEKTASVPALLQYAAVMIAGALILIAIAQFIKIFK